MASLHNIHVRTGCFCNTGACQRHLGISDEMVKKHLQVGTGAGGPNAGQPDPMLVPNLLQRLDPCLGWGLVFGFISLSPPCERAKKKGSMKLENASR